MKSNTEKCKANIYNNKTFGTISDLKHEYYHYNVRDDASIINKLMMMMIGLELTF